MTIPTEDMEGSNSMRFSVGGHLPLWHDEQRIVQHTLREVTRATRLDWQIDADELRSACEAGRRERSYPYAKP